MRERYLFTLGAIFILFSGMIYTFKKNFVLLMGHIERLGFRIAKISGTVPEPKAEVNNPFVWIFLLAGLGFILYGLIKESRSS